MKSSISSLFVVVVAVSIPAAGEDHPDRLVQPKIPQGKLTAGEFSDSRLFAGTRRQYSVYVPAQYRDDRPAKLMVFMDGSGYAKLDGAFRVPIVFDNLIHQRAMPVTIAVFVNPGTIPATKPGASDRSNRSFEYDSLGDRYATFLVDEFLPAALKGLNVSKDPQDRAVCGISSGGICAFTVAWERPDQFGKVMSHIGSFTNIRGGWAYPGLVRKTKDRPKPIKVYLQDGKDDLNNLHGNWPLGNQDLAAALQFAGYHYKLVMTEGGHSGKWAGEDLPNALRWLWSEDSEPTSIPVVETKPSWKPHPDAVAKDDVPHGTIEQMPAWESKIFSDTIRDWSIYIPAQYKESQPAALMIFQDGERMRDINGRWRVPIVFDNLIARGEMPPTVAVFINPGHDKSRPLQNNRASNRGYEYDSLGDRYVRFLLEEIIPEVEKRYRISPDPEMRAVGGSSSGAICSFTAAWERPDIFRKVYSSVGSFTNLRGGNVYPALIRKTEPKPIRVYMADTSGDVDNAFGSWWWSNQRMASALKYMGYDVRFDSAEGYAHNADFGSSRFPEAMKWLWKEEPHKPVLDTSGDLGGDLTLLNLLIPGESWEVAADKLGFADALCADADGNLYFSDMKAPAVYRLNVNDGSRTEIVKEAVSGLKLSADGLLYGCQGAQNRLISINVNTGAVGVVASNVTPNDLVVSADGFIFITETKAQQVTRIDIKKGTTSPVDTGISRPNGIALSNDGGTLAVSDHGGEFAWMFRLNADGVLDAKLPTMPLRLPIDDAGEFKFNEPPPYITASRGDGMAVDKKGRYYITSALGVQIFDPTGRPCGVLPKPDRDQPLTTCTLGGPHHSTLYIAHGSKVYRRKLNVE
ncbi:MAG TPA: alpha/beta hydrolase-fold protein [Pirellulaceae bacterium]|nr:alpha/beta hydrolase-fold protein [Pirellulaceae bacterium]